MNCPTAGNIILKKCHNITMNINQVQNNIIIIIYTRIRNYNIIIFKCFKLISEYPWISNSNNKIILIVQSCACDNLWLTI